MGNFHKNIEDISPDLEKIAKETEEASNAAFNATLTPEVLAAMTPDQKQIIDEARNAFKLKPNQSMAEKLSSLQDTLSKIK